MKIKTIMSAGIVIASMMTMTAGAQEVNIYSSRHYQTDERLYQDFTDATGIRINRIEGNGDALVQRIKQEGRNSPADVLITVDAGRLWRADQAGVFSSVTSQALSQAIPENLRHPEGHWFGYSSRARLIFVNPDLVDPALVTRYEDLSRPELEGMVCIRSSSNIYNLSLMASLIHHHGAQEAEAWARAVVANFARRPQGGDTDQLRAAASGECGVAVANSYYFARLMKSDDAGDQAVVEALEVIFPNQEDRGAHVNISGAGVVTTAPNRENAIKFLEYLASQSAQQFFAEGNNEYPTVPGTLRDEALITLGDFKVDPVNVDVYGSNQPEAQRVFDRAGWP